MNVVVAIYKDLRLDYRNQVACLQLRCSQFTRKGLTEDFPGMYYVAPKLPSNGEPQMSQQESRTLMSAQTDAQRQGAPEYQCQSLAQPATCRTVRPAACRLCSRPLACPSLACWIRPHTPQGALDPSGSREYPQRMLCTCIAGQANGAEACPPLLWPLGVECVLPY